MADFAPGLPKKSVRGDPRKLRAGQQVDLIIQQHDAERAGRHYDVRFGTKKTGLFSWATKKEIPRPKERIALFQQPLHRHEYKDFEGVIPEGYGKGSVRKTEVGKLLISKVEPDTIHFTKIHKKTPERFVLVRPREEGDTRWLLVNTTPTEPVPYEKQTYRSVAPEKAEEILSNLQPGTSVQAKIDGAASLVKLLDDRLEVMSYRVAKTTGHPIIHTERLFAGKPVKVKIPKELRGTLLRGELYGLKDKKAIPPQELGGLLNSSVMKSIEDQKKRGIKLKNMVFDIEQHGKKDVRDLPYVERRELIEEVLKHLPKAKFHPPEEATTSEEALKIWKAIKSGKNPFTHEGIVVHPPTGKPTKIKLTGEYDVHITGFFPGEGKHKDAIGGFTYSHEPGGKTVGRVGTGFSDKTRREMAKNPEEYIGRVARVQAQEKLPSGALRAPTLLALHEDYPIKLAHLCAHFFGGFNEHQVA